MNTYAHTQLPTSCGRKLRNNSQYWKNSEQRNGFTNGILSLKEFAILCAMSKSSVHQLFWQNEMVFLINNFDYYCTLSS